MLSHAVAEGERLVVAGGGALYALQVDGQGGLLEAARIDLQMHVACMALTTVRVNAVCVVCCVRGGCFPLSAQPLVFPKPTANDRWRA